MPGLFKGLRQARVKTWGKSPRDVVVTQHRGKPYGLQVQVCRRSRNPGKRAARPMPAGRMLEPCSDVWPREMIEPRQLRETESRLQACTAFFIEKK